MDKRTVDLRFEDESALHFEDKADAI